MHETFRLRRSFGTALLPIAITIFLALVPFGLAQSMSHEEETVRNAYAKVTLLTAVQTVSDTATNPDTATVTDISGKIARSQPVFDLSNFQVGAIADIASQPWKQYVSTPVPGQLVLQSVVTTFQHSNNGNPTEWYGVTLSWVPAHQHSPDEVRQRENTNIADIIKIGSPYWSSVPVTYTRYAAFTVDATFEGKSTGPHKAIFFFGHDANGKEYVAGSDLMSGTQALWEVLRQKPMYPTGLLRSNLRDLPVVATWVRANEMPASSCTAGHDLCCSNGHCGISQTDLNRDLAAPLPKAKVPVGDGQ